MKNVILVLFCFIYLSSYSQSKKRDSIYLLINKEDSLIKKINRKDGLFDFYNIFYTERVKILRNNTPVVEGRVWVADAKYNYYVYTKYSLQFWRLSQKKQIITKDELSLMNDVDNRESFLKKMKKNLDYHIFFIEESCNERYITYKVGQIFYE